MDLNAAIGFGTALGTAVIALFTYFAARHAKQTVMEAAKSATRGQFSARQTATIRFLTSWMKTYLRLPDAIDNLKGKVKATNKPAEQARLSKELRNAQIELFYVWESVAAGINASVFDLEIVNQMTGSRILSNYRDNAQFVRRRRRQESLRFYDQLDIVIDRLLEIRYSEHLLTTRTFRQLKEAHVDPETIRRLTTLPRNLYNSDKELSLALVQQGLEREKNLISAYSRHPCYSIVPYNESHQAGVIDLFVSIQDVGGDSSPGRAWPGVGKEQLGRWLFKEAKALHNFVLLYTQPRPPEYLGGLRSHDLNKPIVGFVALDYLEDTLANTETIWLDRLGSDWKQNAFGTGDAGDGYDLKDIVFVRRFAIHPRLRRIGVGKFLLRHAIRTIQELDAAGDSIAHGPRGTKRRPRVAGAVIPDKLTEAIHLCQSEGGLRIGKGYREGSDDMSIFFF